jgi:type IV pilus assembly protein PilQ
VPFFSDLPIVGNLFKSTIEIDDRTELLIFVTPKILQGASLDIR